MTTCSSSTLLNFLPLALLLISACAGADDAVEIDSIESFEDFLIEEREDQHIPASAVLVFDKESILYEDYRGFSNLDSELALASNHMFLIASISKVVTATALLQLYDQQKFDLDEDINNYLPYQINIPGHSGAVSFRNLFTHTSGIADNPSVFDAQYFYDEDPTIGLGIFMYEYFTPGANYYDAANNFHDFAPGSQHEYSNTGSALLAAMVQYICGVDFRYYCQTHIFDPLGMRNTSWSLGGITQPIVTPYDYLGGENVAIRNYTFTDYPNGGLRTTARDLHKFVSALASSGRSGATQLLEPATVALMHTPQIPNLDDEVGLHLFVMNSELGLWGHDGGEQGVATIFGFNPTTGIGAIILTNQGEAELEELLQAAVQLGKNL